MESEPPGSILAQLLSTCGVWKMVIGTPALWEAAGIEGGSIRHTPPAACTDQMLSHSDFPFSSPTRPGTWFCILAREYLGPSMSVITNISILLLHPLKNVFSFFPHACGFHFHYKSHLFALSFVSSRRCDTSAFSVPLFLFPGRDCVCEKLSA